MTPKEAAKIADTLVTADGGCSVCTGNLADAMQDDFPEFDWKKLVAEARERETAMFAHAALWLDR